jgi:hypothetical protein
LEIGEISEPDLEITSTSIWLQLLLLIGRELVRSFLAFALLGLLFVTVWSTLGKVGKPAFKDAKELLKSSCPPRLLSSAQSWDSSSVAKFPENNSGVQYHCPAMKALASG